MFLLFSFAGIIRKVPGDSYQTLLASVHPKAPDETLLIDAEPLSLGDKHACERKMAESTCPGHRKCQNEPLTFLVPSGDVLSEP